VLGTSDSVSVVRLGCVDVIGLCAGVVNGAVIEEHKVAICIPLHKVASIVGAAVLGGLALTAPTKQAAPPTVPVRTMPVDVSRGFNTTVTESTPSTITSTAPFIVAAALGM